MTPDIAHATTTKWQDQSALAPAVVRPSVAPLGRAGLLVDRPLGRISFASRWLLRGPGSRDPWLGYRLDPYTTPRSQRAFQLATQMLTSLRHRHILAPCECVGDSGAGAWLIARYPGSSDGLRRLDALIEAREGARLSPFECRWTAEQVLAAVAHAHAEGFAHGPIGLEDLVIDRRGSVLVELYGAARRLRDRPVADDADRADEVRAVLATVFRALTGSRWDDLRPARIERAFEASPELGAWLETGLCSLGFSTAREAADALAGSDRRLAARRISVVARLRRRLSV